MESALEKAKTLGRKLEQEVENTWESAKSFGRNVYDGAKNLVSDIQEKGQEIARTVSSSVGLDAVSHNKYIVFTKKQVEKKFYHAPAFGVSGNNNGVNRQLFIMAMQAHIDDTETQIIPGTARGLSEPVVHFYNPHTNLVVTKRANDVFHTAYKLLPHQVPGLTNRGVLGGGD
jgi:hypothetical protein